MTSDYKLRLRISQYDFDQQSKRVNTITHEYIGGDIGELSFAGCKWGYKLDVRKVNEQIEGIEVKARIELLQGKAQQCNVALEFVFDNWSVANYVLMPAAAYNGNRFESRRIAYSPKLLDTRDIGQNTEPIVSDIPRLNKNDGPSFIQERSGAMSVPSMGFYAPATQKGFLLYTPQKTHLGDYGYHISETSNREKAIFMVTAPVVREHFKYRITDNQFPSDDKAPDWNVGDNVEMQVRCFLFDCPRQQDLFDHWNLLRNNLVPRPEPFKSLPFSSAFPIQEEKFNTQNWVEKYGYYSVGMREMFLQDWQLGWTGGMITTYPLLFDGTEKTSERVIRNFDFLFPEGLSPSGFFYDCGEGKDDGFHWYGGDIRKPHTASWHLIRKSGDGLYYIIKQFWLMEKLGISIKPAWRDGIQRVAGAFVKLWQNNGQTGQFVDSITGEIIVGGSTSAGIAPAGLTYAAIYLDNSDYLRVAEEMAQYFYENYVSKGLTMGGPGDALQNPDSESAYGVLESFAVLYEQTGNHLWLERAEEMASQFLTWVIGYNYEFPGSSTLGKLGVKTLGAVYANTQNKHGAPGICTHSGAGLLRLYRATGKVKYLESLRDIARFIPQLFSYPNRPIPGMKPGWITERVSTTDWFEGIGELMYGSTWAETALLLTYAEIPAIYVVPDKGFVFEMDHLNASISSSGRNENRLVIKNPTGEKVKAKVLIETSMQQKRPLGENYLYNALITELGPGEEKQFNLK